MSRLPVKYTTKEEKRRRVIAGDADQTALNRGIQKKGDEEKASEPATLTKVREG